MPKYKYFANRFLTFIQNILMHQKLTEYHTGYRAYSVEVLKKIKFELNSDDSSLIMNDCTPVLQWLKIAEITCPTKYFEKASSITFRRSLKYGFGVLGVSFLYFLTKTGIYKWRLLVN